MEGCTKERLEKDLEQIKTLVGVLEEESGVKGSDKVEEKISSLLEKREAAGSEDDQELAKVCKQDLTDKLKLSLDLYIVYLRRVHFFDFYTAMETDFVESLNRRAGVSFRATIKGLDSNDWAARFFERLDNKLEMRIKKILSGPELEKLGVCSIVLIE